MAEQPVSAEVGIVAKALLASAGGKADAAMFAKVNGAPPRCIRVLEKAAVGAARLGDTSYGEVLADWLISSGAFFVSMRTQSVFFRLLDSGFRKVPLRTRMGVISLGASAYVAGEGRAIPISKLTLGQPTLEPSLAAVILVTTDEVARHMGADASNLVNAEMRAALAETVDAEFFSLVIDGSTPTFSSSGNDAEDMRRDLGTLLAATNVRGGALAWAMSPDVGNRAALIDDARGAMSPIGGELLGLPAIVSAAIPEGTLRLVNASAIAANADPIELDASREATLEMSDAPASDATAPTAAEMVSLFQTNSAALLAKVHFAAERTRDDAVSQMEDIAWGDLESS